MVLVPAQVLWKKRSIMYHFKNPMRVPLLLLTFIVLMPAFAGDADWPRWRGPDNDGMARGDAPMHWSDTEHIKWKAEIPGRGHSSPVIWGDKVFVTTSVPTGVVPPAAPEAEPAPPGRGGRGFGNRGPQPEQAVEAEEIPARAADSRWPFPAAGALEGEAPLPVPRLAVGQALASSSRLA